MYVTKVVLVLCLLSGWCTASTRIWFRGCGKTGFSCFPKIGPKKTFVIECPSKVKEYHIYINEFNGPNSLEYIKIQNCKTLTILFRCSKYRREKKNLRQLQISNVEKLKFLNVQKFQQVLPPIVVFQNIKTIERIPSYTFTQTDTLVNAAANCVLPDYKLQSLHFKNVSIDTVEVNAFFLLHDFVNLTFTDVKIKSLNTASFFVKQNGVFQLQDSVVDLIEPLAVEIDASGVVIDDNTFAEIHMNGFKVISDTFTFTKNAVNQILHSQAFSVLSKNTLISSNHLQYLEKGAFSSMSTSNAGFGTFEFSKNRIYDVEDDCLVPDLSTYMEPSRQVSFIDNIFSCYCSESELLLTKIGVEGPKTITSAFYEDLFDEKSKNTCYSTCNLPLGLAKAKIIKGKCNENKTPDDLCAAMKELNSEESTTTEISSSSFSYPSSSEYSSEGTYADVESTTLSVSLSTELLETDSSSETSPLDVSKDNPTSTQTNLRTVKIMTVLPTRHDLTTATSIKTTIRPTKYKFLGTTESYRNDVTIIEDYKEDATSKYTSMWSNVEFLVTSRNATIENSSNVIFFSSSLIVFCFGFLKIFL